MIRMKKIFIILVLATVLGFIPALKAQLNDSLVAWYPFNGNANDESGNGYNGVLLDPHLTKDRCLEDGKAYYFNGYWDYIKILNSENLHLTDKPFSLVVWFLGGGGPLIAKCNPYSGNGFQLNCCCTFHLNGSCLSSYGGFVDSLWHQAVVVCNSSMQYLFMDGIPEDSCSYSEPETNDKPLTIGGHYNSHFHNFFTGAIDDIRIYKRALTPLEVQQLYDEKPFFSVGKIFTEKALYCKYEEIKIRLYATGSPILQFRWQKDGQDIPGADKQAFTIPSASAADSGNYRCIVTNSLGVDTTEAVSIDVFDPIKSQIQGKPEVRQFETATYSVPKEENHQYLFLVSGGTLVSNTDNSVTVYWEFAGQGSVTLVESLPNGCVGDTVVRYVMVGPASIGNRDKDAFSVYPNPFLFRTDFSYTLEYSSGVNLQIMNGYGQLISEPLNAMQPAGDHHFIWEAGCLPAGIYYYKMKADQNVWTGKLILIK